MDSTLTDCLKKGAINEQTIGVLEEEMVRTMETFILLKEEHFERLLPRLKVGQHAQLLKLWEEMQVCSKYQSTLNKIIVGMCLKLNNSRNV